MIHPKLITERGASLQEYIGERLGISAGQVRTIKRMMEEVNILIPGALNSQTVRL